MSLVAAVAAMVPVARAVGMGWDWAVLRRVDLRPMEREVAVGL